MKIKPQFYNMRFKEIKEKDNKYQKISKEYKKNQN